MSGPDVNIDLNRGVSKRIEPKSKITVCMYKDDPGIYYDIAGRVISKAIAKKAGFDVAKEDRRRKKMNRLKEAQENINSEFDETETNEVVYEKGDYKVVSVGKKVGHIIDNEGNAISSTALPYAECRDIIAQLIDSPPEESEDEEPNEENTNPES